MHKNYLGVFLHLQCAKCNADDGADGAGGADAADGNDATGHVAEPCSTGAEGQDYVSS